MIDKKTFILIEAQFYLFIDFPWMLLNLVAVRTLKTIFDNLNEH